MSRSFEHAPDCFRSKCKKLVHFKISPFLLQRYFYGRAFARRAKAGLRLDFSSVNLLFSYMCIRLNRRIPVKWRIFILAILEQETVELQSKPAAPHRFGTRQAQRTGEVEINYV